MGQARELEEIHNLIHDDWFRLSEVDHDRVRSEVRIPIRPTQWTKRFIGWSGRQRNRDGSVPAPVGTLIVQKVMDLSVEDDRGIDGYTIEALKVLADPLRLTIQTGQGMGLEISVTELDVAFEPKAPERRYS